MGRGLAITLLTVAVVIWGSTYVVTKDAIDDAPPMLFALLRHVFASVVLLVLVAFRRSASAAPMPSLMILLVMGFAGVTFYYGAFNLAIVYTTASQGALVQSSVPAVTAIMAALWLGERVSRTRAAGIALAIAGVLILLSGTSRDSGARSPLLGNLLMFGTAISWGVYTMYAKRFADADPVRVTAAITVLGTLMLVPVVIFEAGGLPSADLTSGTYLRAAYLGVFSSAVAFLLYIRALRDLDASMAGAFTNLAPVIGVVSGVVVLKESVSSTALVGGAVVLVGVWLSSRNAATE